MEPQDEGPIYSVLTGKLVPPFASGDFDRVTRNYGGTVGTLIQPGSWSNTASSMTVTVNPGVGVQVFFTVSGATGSIALNGSTAGSPPGFFSEINYGGGTLEKYGTYSYENNLNAGSYWTSTLSGPAASGFNPPTTYTYNFTNAVITSMGVRWLGNVYDGIAANYSPAVDYSYSNNGLTLNYKIYGNAGEGRLFFTVPAGTARNVTFLVNNRRGNGTFYGQRYWPNPLRAASARTGFNQLSGDDGPINEWAHPWAANNLYNNNTNYYGSKTILLDPGDYWLLFVGANWASVREYADGTIAIA